MMAFLILANVALLVVVGLFLAKEFSSESPPTAVADDERPAVEMEVGPSLAVPTEAEEPALAVAEKKGDEPPKSPSPAPGIAQAPSEVPSPSPAPPSLSKITLDASPTGAFFTSQSHGAGSLPKVFELGPAEVVRGVVRLNGHRARSFTLKTGDPPLKKLLLSRLPTGNLKLRFFPASAGITIDSKRIEPTGSNVLAISLPIGEHTLKVALPGGQKVRRQFVIRAGAETNLQTIDLTRGPK
jgi:hypothetical protein